MEADTGRIVAMASQPTYDPSVWVGGITKKQLAGALLREGRHAAAQPGHPGPVRPRLDVEAVHDRRCADQRLLRPTPGCRAPRRSRSATAPSTTTSPAAYGNISFAKALEVSCNTFFYRVGFDYWQQYGSDAADVDARDPLVEEAEKFGFGSETGIDLPGEASGRIADRHWKRAYYRSMKDYYCGIADKPQDADTSRLRLQVRPRVLRRGLRVQGHRRGQLRHRPGRHHRHPAPARPRLRRHRQRRHALRPARRPRRGGRRRHRHPAHPARGDRSRRTARPTSSATSTRRSRASPARARWPGGWAASRSTRSRSAPRPARPRSTASSRRRGSRPTPTTTSW